jgi:hypothetical protein
MVGESGGHAAQNPNLAPDHPESNVSSVSLHNGEVYPHEQTAPVETNSFNLTF